MENKTTPGTITPAHPSSFGGSVGGHLGRRLAQIGVKDVFSVPGDFNLTLLDDLIAEPELNLVGCCNELNAGYAADGNHGGSSAPGTSQSGSSHLTTTPQESIGVGRRTSNPSQAVVNNLDDAHELIDTAISTALKESKPAYISISCNLPGISHPTFAREPVPYFLSPKVSNQLGLEAAVEATVEFLNKAVKPILIGGPKLRVAKAQQAFVELADTCGYPIAVMPAGKGLVPEHHPHFIGTYWGAVSTSYVGEVVESADAYVFVGPIFNDYSSVGYSLLIKKERAVIVEPNRVTIANGPSYGWVFMADFLCALAKKLKRNTTAMENYRRIFVPPGMPVTHANGEPLRVNVLFKHVQDMIDGNTAVIAETGDSWFNCQKLRLPEGCGYFFSPVVE